MKSPLPPLTWFRAFEAAARHLSFTAAAEEIGLTQSAVSQHVKALETRLHVTLFTRRARGLSLTDDGRRLLPQVGSALEMLAAAAESFSAGPSQTLLTVAASVSVAQWVVAPNLTSFTAEHPNISLRFLSAVWPDDFHTALADVDIRFGSEKQVGKNATAMQPSQLIALKSPSLTLPLSQLPLIEAVGTSDGWHSWREAFADALQTPRVFADSYGMAMNLAAQGNGVALVSALLAGHACRTGVLVRAHPGEIAPKEGYYVSVNRPSIAANAFQHWLLSLPQLDSLSPLDLRP